MVRPPGGPSAIMADVIAPQHDRFARAIAEGFSGGQAYKDHVAAEWMEMRTATSAGARLLAREDVKARVKFWKASLPHVLEQVGYTQETALRQLAEAAVTPLAEIDEHSVHAVEVIRTRQVVGVGEDAKEWETEKIKKVNPLDAIKQLAVMVPGWEAEKKSTVQVGVAPEVRAALTTYFEQD